MTEKNIQSEIMLALSRAGCLIFRNNTGNAVSGVIVKQSAGRFIIETGRRIQFGLCVGSADLIGIAPGGKFLAVEVKTDSGRATPEQHNFINAVRKAGGIAGVVRNTEQALELLTNQLF